MFPKNLPELRGLLVTLRPMDFRSTVRALGRCRFVLLRTVLPRDVIVGYAANDRPGSPQGCPVASRHSARRSGGEGANQKNVSLEQVPLAGSLSLKGRQAEFYKYQSGRRRTANSEASPNQKPRRTALYSPAEVAAQGRPRERDS